MSELIFSHIRIGEKMLNVGHKGEAGAIVVGGEARNAFNRQDAKFAKEMLSGLCDSQ